MRHAQISALLMHAALPSLVAVSLCAATSVLLDLRISSAFYVAAFAGTFLIYVVDRLAPYSPEDAVNRPDPAVSRIAATAMIAVPMLVLGASLVSLPLRTNAAAGMIGLLGFAYVLPIGGRRLKDVGAMKPVLIAAGWSIGAVILPIVDNAGAPDWSAAFGLAVYRFLYILPNTILFDLRDVEGDVLHGIHTPAVRLGRKSVVRLSLLVAVLTIACALILSFRTGPLLLVDAIGMLLMIGLIAGLPDPSTGESTLLLDAALLWPAILMIVG